MTSHLRRFYIIKIMLQVEHSEESQIVTCILYLAFLILVLYAIYRKWFSKKRLDAVRNRVPLQTKSDQVLVAIDIDNLLVQTSDRKRPGFSQVELSSKSFQFAYEKLKEMFGMGVFYRPKTSVKNMKGVLQSLADNPKVKLFLYTTLSLEVAQKILQRLCLLNFFPLSNRRSSSDCYSEALKHPTEVDCNTKRVIIVTGSRNDHSEEDSKYFLVLKRKELSDSIKCLNKVINKNRDIDELHNELGELKPHLESDYENVE